MTAKYWVFKVTEETGGIYRRPGFEIYCHRMTDGFWGLRSDETSSKTIWVLNQLEKDDKAVFYLVEPGKASRFLGTATLASGFATLNTDQTKRILHKEFMDCETGVFLKDIDRWSKTLPAEKVRGKGAFSPGHSQFSQFFQGSFKQLRSREEFETIVNEQRNLASSTWSLTVQAPRRKVKHSAKADRANQSGKEPKR